MLATMSSIAWTDLSRPLVLALEPADLLLIERREHPDERGLVADVGLVERG